MNIRNLRRLGKERSLMLQAKPTKQEASVRNALKFLLVKHRFNHPVICNRNLYLVDFYLPRHKIVIEVDGPSHLKTVVYDRIREEQIGRKLRVRFIRLTNHEVDAQHDLAGFLMELIRNKHLKEDEALHQAKVLDRAFRATVG